MSDFITDVERQYELYCKIAEEHGFIDLNAKKNDFRCTTKSSEFNAGWIAFVGAVAAVRDEQQTIIDNLKTQLNNMETCYIEKKKQVEELQGKSRCIKSLVEQRNLAENMLRKISVAAQKKLPTFGAALRFNDEVKEILRGES